MSEVFSARSLIYWWGVLSATVFIKDWLKQLADFLRNSGMFSPANIPFNFLPGLNSWIDGAAKYIRDTVKFDPTQAVVTIGSFVVLGWMLALFLGFLLLVIAIVLYGRALVSPSWFDDFLAIFVIYFILRIISHIVALTSLPILDSFRNFLDNPGTSFIFLLALLIFLSFFGEGFRSKRAFWRALIEAALVSLFIFPHETATILAYGVDALAQFGAGLSLAANLPFAIIWGLLGMFLALQRLMSQETFVVKARE
jgi:hypothetical protein